MNLLYHTIEGNLGKICGAATDVSSLRSCQENSGFDGFVTMLMMLHAKEAISKNSLLIHFFDHFQSWTSTEGSKLRAAKVRGVTERFEHRGTTTSTAILPGQF